MKSINTMYHLSFTQLEYFDGITICIDEKLHSATAKLFAAGVLCHIVEENPMPMSSQASRAIKAVRQTSKKLVCDPSQHYLITPTAAIWTGAPAIGHPVKPVRLTRWARLPLNISVGKCLGLRAPLPGGSQWQVCIERSGQRSWLPLEGVLSQKILAHWIRTGF